MHEVPGSIPDWNASVSDALCRGCRWPWSSPYNKVLNANAYAGMEINRRNIFLLRVAKKEILTFASFSNYAGLFITCPWWPNVYRIQYIIYTLYSNICMWNPFRFSAKPAWIRHKLCGSQTSLVNIHAIPVLDKTCRPRIHAGCQFSVFRSRARMDPYWFDSSETGSAMTIATGTDLDPVDQVDMM